MTRRVHRRNVNKHQPMQNWIVILWSSWLYNFSDFWIIDSSRRLYFLGIIWIWSELDFFFVLFVVCLLFKMCVRACLISSLLLTIIHLTYGKKLFFNLFILQDIKLNKEFKRNKRASSHRGQTQSQYLSFGNDDDGKASAEATSVSRMSLQLRIWS